MNSAEGGAEIAGFQDEHRLPLQTVLLQRIAAGKMVHFLEHEVVRRWIVSVDRKVHKQVKYSTNLDACTVNICNRYLF